MRSLSSLLLRLVPLTALALLAACGGSSHSDPVYAKVLNYTNPPGSGYRLQADPATNGTASLALQLVGPSGAQIQGLSFYLTCDPSQVSWHKGSTAPAYATAGSVLALGEIPQAFVATVTGGDLQVGLFQASGTATLASAPIVTVGLDLAATKVPTGTTLALAPTPGTKAVFVDRNGVVQEFSAPIAVGTLSAE
jgi:hypothetical protein